jgi:hypothetical protein
MKNREDYGLQLGDRVEIPYYLVSGKYSRLCDTHWVDSEIRSTATVVGWSDKNQPMAMIDEGCLGGSADPKPYHAFADREFCPEPNGKRFWFLVEPTCYKKVER